MIGPSEYLAEDHDNNEELNEVLHEKKRRTNLIIAPIYTRGRKTGKPRKFLNRISGCRRKIKVFSSPQFLTHQWVRPDQSGGENFEMKAYPNKKRAFETNASSSSIPEIQHIFADLLSSCKTMHYKEESSERVRWPSIQLMIQKIEEWCNRKLEHVSIQTKII